MRRIMIAAGLALSGALLVGGCQFGGGGGSGEKQTGKAAAPSSAAASAAPSQGGPAPAKRSFTYPGLDKGGTVTVGFQSLQVRGQLAVLSLTWTPNVPGSADTDTWNIGQMTSGDNVAGGNIDLVDTQNLKRYVIVKDSSGNRLGSSGNGVGGYAEPPNAGQSAKSGQTITATYTYAAPPPNVSSIDVYGDEHALFTNVPITR